ncbi:MAG: amidohydrolase family protein, partial [Bacteroidales bacterium]|nr:amidohydrolase family protein [Bacteroidales bacterium]
ALEEAVMQAKSVGCTGFKLYVNYSKSDLERLVPIIKKHGMKIWAHSSQVMGATAMDVAESGVEVMSHAYMIPKYFYPAATLSQNDKEYVSSVLDKMVENNVVLDATYKLSLRNGTTFASEVIKAAYEKGVKLVVGTDLPGCELHNEIELLSKDCGISNIDLLKAATLTGAEILGKKGVLGEISVGAEADAIILSANPLTDLSAINDIYITISNGQIVYDSTTTASGEEVLYNVNIVDTEKGRVRHGKTIHIQDGKIAKISRASKAIETGQTDMTGKYVVPGLIDAHVHFGNMAQNPDMAARLSEDFLKAGVTTVRDMGSNFLNIKRYQEDLAAGLYKGPRVFYSSFWATGNYFMDPLDVIGWEGGPDAPWSRKFSIKDSTDVAIAKAVKEAKDIGCTGFKLYIHYSQDDIKRLVPIARQFGMKVWAHATQVTGATALEMAESGIDVLSHAYMLCDDIKARDALSQEEIEYVRKVCKRLKKNNVVLDITAYISLFDGLKFSNDIVKIVCEEKVPFVVGTDFFGSAMAEEIGCLKNAGYSNKDILYALTVAGAKILGEQGTLGCIKEGAYADLLILSANPLSDISALQEIELLKH